MTQALPQSQCTSSRAEGAGSRVSEGVTEGGELLARGRREQQEEVELVRARIAARPRGPGDGPHVGSFTGFKTRMPVQHIAKVSVAEYSLFYPSSAHGFLCPIF